jgi:protein kinase-like protein
LTAETTDRPHTIGPYRIEALIGRGGMGEVYRAFDTRRGRTVALKILPRDLALDEGFRARFRRESDTAARLQNQHVIPIHDFGEIDGRLFIDMRLVDGVGLDRLVAAGPMDPHRAVHLVAQVAEALADAHAHGVLHRDVKPSNVLVTRGDFAYLADFGIARVVDDRATALTHTGEAVGTLAYMAPERFGDGPADARSDVYSLTCVLAECLTGHRPFPAAELPALVHAHLAAPPPRPSLLRPGLPPALDEVVARGMAKDVAARYPTPRELAAAAQHALRAGFPTAYGPVPAAHGPAPAPRPARRGPVVAAVVAGAAVLLAATGAVGFALGRTGEQPARSTTLSAPPTTRPAQNAAADPAPPAPEPSAPPAAPTGDRPAFYEYAVQSNHPITLVYTDSAGDQITDLSAEAPWTYRATTAEWGRSATPMLVASSTSTRGDTTVTCTITDDTGRVVASNTQEAAFASALCLVFG